MNGLMDRMCAKVVGARPVAAVPPGFAGRVMAHVRERSAEAMEGWFLRRVAMPIMAGGGAASMGLGLIWLWLMQAGYMAEISTLLSGNTWAGF